MKVVLDTNVVMSGFFFGGIPYRIVKAGVTGAFQIVVSEEIVNEYYRVGEILAAEFPRIDIGPILKHFLTHVMMVEAPLPSIKICEDPHDDKFIACAIACGGKLVVSGDKHLLRLSGYEEVEIVRPKTFVEKYLT